MPSLRSAVAAGTAMLCAWPLVAPYLREQRQASVADSLVAPDLQFPSWPDWGDLVCLLEHCSVVQTECIFEPACRKTALCNAGCQGKPDELACDLLCELSSGYNSTKYRKILQCMNEHHCLPVQPGTDGVCLSAKPSEAGKALVSMDQMAGKWFIFRGMNCGQKDWPAGFDAFPCQRDEFVKTAGATTGWLDHIAYCGGNVTESQECKTEIVNTVADVYISQPGVMTHNYTDAPLLPQNEEWRVLSWPDQGDWMLYIYCGYTPTGAYAGGSVVSRSKTAKSMADIPAKYEAEFKKVAAEYGFKYDDMCVSDLTNCGD